MDELDDVLAATWRKMQPRALERARRIEVWAGTGEPAPSDVLDDAHKLAGALGMYGLTEASDAAHRLDQLARAGTTGAAVQAVARALAAAVEAGR